MKTRLLLCVAILLTAGSLRAQEQMRDFARQVHAGQAAAVLPALRSYVDTHDGDLHGWIILGQAYLQTKQLDSARRAAERVLAVEPSNTAARDILHAVTAGTTPNPAGLDTAPAGPPPGYSEFDVAPNPTRQIMPVYPDDAKAQGVEGTVYVKLLVTSDGRVGEAQVLKSDAPSLNQAAIDAALRWTFTPAKKGDASVPVWITLPFRFKLATDGSK
jgi:TonB family protein